MHRLQGWPARAARGGDADEDEETEAARRAEQVEMIRLIRERQLLSFPQSQAGDLTQDARLERASDSQGSEAPQVCRVRTCVAASRCRPARS